MVQRLFYLGGLNLVYLSSGRDSGPDTGPAIVRQLGMTWAAQVLGNTELVVIVFIYGETWPSLTAQMSQCATYNQPNLPSA